MAEVNVQTQQEALATFSAALQRRLSAQPDAIMRYCPPSQDTSILDILGELIIWDARWRNRIAQMVVGRDPRFILGNTAELLRTAVYRKQDVSRVLNGFVQRRAAMLSYLDTLIPQDVDHTGIHPTAGRMCVTDALQELVEHDQACKEQIEALLTSAPHAVTNAPREAGRLNRLTSTVQPSA
jgi:hypothetical protein